MFRVLYLLPVSIILTIGFRTAVGRCESVSFEKLLSGCHYFYSQQQNALGYNLSMQGIGTVAIDGPRFEEFLRSRKDFLRSRKGGVSRKGVSQGFCCWVAQLG